MASNPSFRRRACPVGERGRNPENARYRERNLWLEFLDSGLCRNDEGIGKDGMARFSNPFTHQQKALPMPGLERFTTPRYSLSQNTPLIKYWRYYGPVDSAIVLEPIPFSEAR